MKKTSLFIIFILFLLIIGVSFSQNNNQENIDPIDSTLPVKDKEEKEISISDEDKPGKQIFMNGSGDFYGVVTNKEENTSVINGAIGMTVLNKIADSKIKNKLILQWEAILSINLASAGDTIKENYGSSVLIPKKGVSSASFQFTWCRFLNGILNKVSVIRDLDIVFYAAYSNAAWQKNDTAIRTTNAALGLLTSYDFARNFFAEKSENSEVRCIVAGGLAFRSIVGDLSFEKNDNFRKGLLGSEQTDFFGLEAKGIIAFKELTISASYMYLFGDRIDGLTKGQLLISVSLGIGLRL